MIMDTETVEYWRSRGLGSYAVTAAELTDRFGISPPLDRRQVELWNRRRTVNRAGQMFPSPARKEPGALRTQPRLMFRISQVAEWYAAGVPGRWGQGWVVPGE
jgi:hypothetical protein